MPQLKHIQNQFQNYLLSNDNEIADLIVEQGNINSDVRLGIYKNAYQVRLIKTIESDHPILSVYLGDELFDQMSGAYLSEYPSIHTSLRHYCDALPQFLSEISPFSDVPVLSELASFERQMMNAFDAADTILRAKVEDLQTIEKNNWPEIKLLFHPSVSTFEAKWNSVEIWQAMKQEQTPPEATESLNHWLIWRGEDRLTQFRNMRYESLLLFNAFNAGCNFAEVCDFLLEHMAVDQIGQFAVHQVMEWLDSGVIYEINYE